jgi:thiosulfate reductase/polysulfide reductase chain A
MELSRRDFLKIGAAAAGAIGATGGTALVTRARSVDRSGWAGHRVGAVTRVPSMCQACTTACGVIGTLKDGRLVSITGNPEDPNSRGSVCAKGTAGPSILYDASRTLYPLKRAGKRGEGKWRRITWKQAYEEISQRLRVIRESGHPEEFAFLQGRNRSTDIVSRFLNAYGTPSHFNHRALCSLNRRAAMLATVGDSDWDLGDYEHSDYVLNFGCNFAEAHQGHIPTVIRIMAGREKRGTKIVTFEARLSNSAAVSDEWCCVKPGTDGLIALAMSQVICSERLWNKEWFDTWSNYSAEDIGRHLEPYTPEFAERESGVAAATIRRIAREFAASAPRCTTISNRGSHAHWNGFYNDRAIILLNAIVGNMGEVGGFNWSPFESWDKKQLPEPKPVPPRPTARSVIADAKDWPLANAWKGKAMRVGEIIFLWIKEKRQKVSALMSYNVDPVWAWPDTELVTEVLRNEDLVPFHVCLDVMYSDTAHLADIVLPWTTWMERWDIDSRPPAQLIDYVGLRQPLVKPLGESKDIREIFPELARRIGGGMEKYFPWRTAEEYFEEYYKPVPGGFEYMRKHGVWQDRGKKPNYRPFAKQLSAKDLEGSTIDTTTGIVHKGEDPDTKEPIAIGIMVKGLAVRGFNTPTRKLEIYSKFINDKGNEVGAEINPLPIYAPVPDHHRMLAGDHLIMISFKWNVHNGHRTMQSKWLCEIVHSNPAWIHPETAKRFGLKEGDWAEVTSYRPKDSLVPHDDGSEMGRMKVPIHITEGVHPLVVAISHNNGRKHGGRVADGRFPTAGVEGLGASDPDVEKNLWWSREMSIAQNSLIPIYPDPRSGQQAYHDTLITIRKV